jgi:hypothetical protein
MSVAGARLSGNVPARYSTIIGHDAHPAREIALRPGERGVEHGQVFPEGALLGPEPSG